jgi:hypothetical protein
MLVLLEVLKSLKLNTKHSSGATADSVEDDGGDRQDIVREVAKDEGLASRDDIVVAHTWWYAMFGLATLMVIQGVVPDLSDQTLVVEQTIATLWAGVQAVPRLIDGQAGN